MYSVASAEREGKLLKKSSSHSSLVTSHCPCRFLPAPDESLGGSFRSMFLCPRLLLQLDRMGVDDCKKQPWKSVPRSPRNARC